MSIKSVYDIAKTEMVIISREPIIRIVAVFILGIITFIHILLHSSFLCDRWDMIALPGSIPFANAYLFNLLQVITVIFFAGYFLTRERNLSTTNVFWVYPVSNHEYWLGKIIGSVAFFFLLNLISISIAIIIHLLISDSPFRMFDYVFYLFTITFPTLVFITGLSLIISAIIPIRAISLLFLVGFFIVFMTSFSNIYHGAFDFTGHSLPNVISEISDFSYIYPYMIQRASFLFLGLGLIEIAIFSFKRIPNQITRVSKYHIRGWLLVGIGVLCGALYYNSFVDIDLERANFANRYNQYYTCNTVHILDQKIIYKEKNETLDLTSELTIQNQQNDQIDTIILYLNPQLHVNQLTCENVNIPYTRKDQVVIIHKTIQPNDQCTLLISYSGKINENICHIDLSPQEFHNTRQSDYILRPERRSAFVEQGCVLLTPEAMWYPTTIPPSLPRQFFTREKEFTRYRLAVIDSTREYTFISQGTCRRVNDSLIFTNQQPLIGLSLCRGLYQRAELYVDSILYEFYYYAKSKSAFAQNYLHLEQALTKAIQNCMYDISYEKKRKYPFRKLSLVEVPASFITYCDTWKKSTRIEPELIFMPERNWSSELANKVYYDESSIWDVNETRFSIEEKKLETHIREYIMGSLPIYTGNCIINRLSSNVKRIQSQNSFDISSLFVDHTCYISSRQYPIINSVIRMIHERTNKTNIKQHFKTTDRTNVTRAQIVEQLSKHSLKEIVEERSFDHLFMKEILESKTFHLEALLSMQVSSQKLETFIATFLQKNEFKNIPFDQFLSEFRDSCGINLDQLLSQWYNSRELPVLLVEDIHIQKINLNEEKYSIQFKVWNPSKTDGVLTFSTSSATSQSNNETAFQHFYIPSGKCMDFHLVQDEAPYLVQIGTNISQNIPSDYTKKMERSLPETQDVTQKIVDISPEAFSPSKDEIIVDNESPGFHLTEAHGKSWILSLFDNKDSNQESSGRWEIKYNSYAYGKVKRSYYTRFSDEGNSSAEWKTEIMKPGYYELYAYNLKFNTIQFLGMKDGAAQYATPSKTMQYYTLYAGTTSYELTLSPFQFESGWVSMGKFHLPAGETKLILRSKGVYVKQPLYADAIKWVYVKEK